VQQKQEEFQAEYKAMLDRGESFAIVKAFMAFWKKESERNKKLAAERASENAIAGSAGRMAAMMDELQNMEELELPMVKIGDASVASPFTSKMPSIQGCLDIIRQVCVLCDVIYISTCFYLLFCSKMICIDNIIM
jgi:manganese-transporting P-type ATPase